MAKPRKKVSKNPAAAAIILNVTERKQRFFRRQSALVQRYYRNQARKELKRKVNKKKFSKETKQILKYVKANKAAVAKKYNSDLVRIMKKKGYFPDEIAAAKHYSLVGKNVHNAIDKLPLMIPNKSLTRFKYRGKWITPKQKNSIIKGVVKRARIKSYMDILGVTKKQAQKILVLMGKDTKLANDLKTLIY
jgi:hypothetical protein